MSCPISRPHIMSPTTFPVLDLVEDFVHFLPRGERQVAMRATDHVIPPEYRDNAEIIAVIGEHPPSFPMVNHYASRHFGALDTQHTGDSLHHSLQLDHSQPWMTTKSTLKYSSHNTI